MRWADDIADLLTVGQRRDSMSAIQQLLTEPSEIPVALTSNPTRVAR
jgi:hypothetical protein